jgi:hypothetical protein
MKYMLAGSEENIAKEWEKYKGFTIRPLASTESYYKKIIKTYSNNAKFLLYGGTPEIRSIFQELGLQITMVDKSLEIVRAMGGLTTLSKPLADNEKLIISDWLDCSLVSEKYDVLLGDDAINMVKWEYFDVFLQQASNMLNDNGVFACHLLVQPDRRLTDMTFAEVVAAYKSGRVKTHYDLASRLNFICYDKATYGMGWQHTIATLGKEKLALVPGDFDFCKTFGMCNSHFYCPPQSEFEALVERYFSIEEIFYPKEHEYCLFEPLYLLKKKNLVMS